LTRKRLDHCFRFLRDGFAVAIGGTLPSAALSSVEILHSDGSGDGTLVWSEEEIPGLSGSGVNACERISDGGLFLQGSSSTSTGVFSVVESEDGGSLTVLFTPMWEPPVAANGLVDFSLYASVIPLEVAAGESDLVWVGGGLDIESGGGVAVASQPRLYDVESQGFEMGFGSDLQPRVAGDWDRWLEPGSVMLSCGHTDGTFSTGQDWIELFEPENGASLGRWELPNRRAGCESVVMRDGSVLVTGGQSETSEAEPWSTAILVPYLE